MKPLGGTWEAPGAHWELVGTSLGVFWGLKVFFGGLWRDLGRALGGPSIQVQGECEEGARASEDGSAK